MADRIDSGGGGATTLAAALRRPWSHDDSMRTLRRLIPFPADIVALDADAVEAMVAWMEGRTGTLWREISRELENLLGTNSSRDLVKQVFEEISRVIVRRQFISLFLKTRSSAAAGGYEDGGLCSICLDGLGGGGDVATLDCRHEYHVRCITKWLLPGNNTCPLCREDAILCMHECTDL